MKSLYSVFYFAVVWLFVSCKNDPTRITASIALSDTLYNVYKIDSLNNVYLIYAMKNGKRFKIVSPKITQQDGEFIQISNSYDFKLEGLFYELVHPGPAGCIVFDSATRVCIEDSIYDIYYSRNIRSLKFIK